MRMAFAALAVAAKLAVAAPVPADDHVVSPQAAQERLIQANDARERDRAAIDRALSSLEAQAAAAVVGADLGRVRASVATLSDAELAEVASRAAALQTDPVAALDQDIKTLLTIFLIIAIVILVLRAVD